MGQPSLVDRLKDWVGHIAWKVFLWSGGWTDETYSEAKYLDEKRYRQSNGTPL